MIYKIIHRTTYRYKHSVSVGNHVACLKPRSSTHQQLMKVELKIMPTPATWVERTDYFGNRQCLFTIQEPHKELVVEARSEVRVAGDAGAGAADDISWEEVARTIPYDLSRFERVGGFRPVCVRVAAHSGETGVC